MGSDELATTRPLSVHERSQLRRRWRAVWPFAVVVACLVCLVVAPFLTDRRTRVLWTELTTVADPARELTTEIELAFTLETGDTRSYLLAPDTNEASDHLRAREQRLRAEERLLPLAERLGPSVVQPTMEWRAQLTPIDMLRDSLYHGLIKRPAYAQRLIGQRERFRVAVATGGKVDAAISATANRIRLEIQATERATMVVDWLLVIVALLAAAVVARIGRRQRLLAVRLDRRERWQTAFGEVARRLNASATARDVMRTLAATGMDATGAEGFVVELERGSAPQKSIDAVVQMQSGELLERRVDYDASAISKLPDVATAGVAGDPPVITTAAPAYVPIRREPCTALAVRVNGDRNVHGTLVLLRGKRDGPPLRTDAAYLPALGDLASAAFHRVHLLESLRESEERFRQIAENIRENVWLADAAYSTVFYVNSAYSEIWGRSKESLYENPWSLLDGVDPEDRARVAAALAELKNGQFDIEYRVVRPNGDVRWVWGRGFPVTNERGEIIRIAGITEDITERKRVTESRVRLVRGFTHDVKNPLGAADGFLALLEDGVMGNLQPSQVDAVGRARRSLQRALELIRNVLELARADAGQIEIDRASMNPGALAEDIVGEFRAQAQEKGVSLELAPLDAVPAIESDSTRVRQILANLVSNAVKYSRPGGHIQVAVSLRSGGDAPRPGNWVAIAVSDDGPGIPAEKQRTLFQEFVRIDPNAAQGAGIGLSISQRLATALGGTIALRSTEGVGSTFTLWLPRTDDSGSGPPAKD